MTQTNFIPCQKEMQIKMVSINKGKVYVMLQSTLALWTPCYYEHHDNTDSCWIPGENYRYFDWNKLPLLRTYWHLSWSRHRYQSAPFNILAELSRIIIFLSSSLSLWLKSEHTDFLFNMILLWNYSTRLQKTVMMYQAKERMS